MFLPGIRTAVLSQDTSSEAEDLQVQIWRAMTPAEKVALVLAASRAAREMARAGIRHRHPDASEHEIHLRLARLTLGDDLARRVYPEIDGLRE